MSLTTPHFGNSFFSYLGDDQFQLPKDNSGKALFLLDTEKQFLSITKGSASLLSPNQTTDLFQISEHMRQHLKSHRELGNHTRDPKLLFFANKQVDELNILIDKHNKHVEQSVWIEFIHVILLILTLGFFNYKDTLHLKDLPKLDVADLIHKHPDNDQKRDCANAVTLHDLLESSRPEEVLKELGLTKAWEETAGKKSNLIEALRAARKEIAGAEHLLLKPLSLWLGNAQARPCLDALIASKDQLEKVTLEDVNNTSIPEEAQIVQMRMKMVPKPERLTAPASLEDFPLAHVQYLDKEVLYDLLKKNDAKQVPPLCFLSKEQISSLPIADLTRTKLISLFRPSFLSKDPISYLQPNQLEALSQAAPYALGAIIAFLPNAHVAVYPKEIPDPAMFQQTLAFGRTCTISHEEKRKKFALLQERLLANSFEILENKVSLLDFSKNPFRVLVQTQLNRQERFANLSIEQVEEILAWIEKDTLGGTDRLGHLLSDNHWKELKMKHFTVKTLPSLFPERDDAENRRALALLAPGMIMHLKSLPGNERLNLQ